MANPIFTKGVATFTFSKARSFPKNDPLKLNVVIDYSEGGQLYAYNKSIAEQLFTLRFNGLTETDRINLLDWWENEAVGALNTFTFTDEAAVEYTVRWVDTQFSVPKREGGVYSCDINLREEI